MSIPLRSLLTLTTALALVVPISAQESEVERLTGPAAPAAWSDTAVPVFAGPTAEAAALMFPSAPLRLDVPAVPVVAAERTSHNVALMVVGGAGLIVGSIVGGDSGTIIMVGSGAVGLLGLFRYLR